MILDPIIERLLPKQKVTYVKWYDSTAQQYAVFDRREPQRNLDLKRQIAGVVAEKDPVFVLDLACGSGRYLRFLRGELVVGVDLSLGMLRHAKEFKDVVLVRADMFSLPFRESTFDLIISMSVIGEHCPLSTELLKGISRIMSLTGTFVFTVIPLHHRLVPSQRYIGFMFPVQIIRLMLRKELQPFSASKLEVTNKLRRFGFETVQIRERHGITTPHFVVVGTRDLRSLTATPE